jgi:flavin-binding protein dodecin
MPSRTYKLVELVGSSEESVHQAVQNAVTRAASSIKGLGWFEVTQIRGLIRDEKVSEFQVTIKIGFRVLSGDEVKTAKRSRKRTGADAGPPPAGWDDDHW